MPGLSREKVGLGQLLAVTHNRNFKARFREEKLIARDLIAGVLGEGARVDEGGGTWLGLSPVV
jgi:hypothetical protein